MVLLVIALVASALLWAGIEWAAVVGLYAALMGERVERCSRCHRFGLTAGGRRHPKGCPPGPLEQLRRFWQPVARGAHLGRPAHFGHR